MSQYMSIYYLLRNRATHCLQKCFSLSWISVMKELNCLYWSIGPFKKENLWFFEEGRRWKSTLNSTPDPPINIQ